MKKILLAGCGLSPQIVTETLYALCRSEDEPFIPDEIHLITTRQGAERARLQLLIRPDGWFHRLCREYELPGIKFTEEHIHVLTDASGSEMDDIKTPEDNADAADQMVRLVAQLTESQNSMLHVSIAGGRKTMGFYLGYALSLFGRPQDRLSHVLVSEPYESLTDFFYPSKKKRVVFTRDNEPLDASKARVWLADIPYVRLRNGIPESLRSGDATFSGVVTAASAAFAPPELKIDLQGKAAICGGVKVDMGPAELAFYAMMADRRKKELPELHCPKDQCPEEAYADEFEFWYNKLNGPFGGHERTRRALEGGMEKHFFEQRKSYCHKRLEEALATKGSVYEIRREKSGKRWVFGLFSLNADQIEIV